MAKGMTDTKHYAAIAGVIRKNSTDAQGVFRPGEMAQKLQAACDFRYGEGCSDGHEKGVADGKQAEYDRFWDVFQDNGNQTNYLYAFSQTRWTDEIFKPKYDIKPTGVNGTSMFQSSGIVNLAEILQAQGIVLDTSGCTSFAQVFQGSTVAHLPEMDLTNSASINYAFSGENLVTIDKILISEKTKSATNTFRNASRLGNIIFDGIIAVNMDLHWSPLTAESIESVISALSGTASGMTASFKQSAVNGAFTAEEWLALVAAKPNWTITLA